MTTYKPYCLGLRTDTVSQVYFAVTQMSDQHNPTMKAELVAHDPSPLHVGLYAAKPQMSFESFALATILDAIGITGIPLTSASTGTGATQFWAGYDANGQRLSGSSHRSVAVAQGLIVPKTIRINHQDDARITCEVFPIQKSGTAIQVLSDSASLPTISVAAARWTLGNMKLFNTAFSNQVSVEIDLGNTVQARAVQSNVFDTIIEVSTHAPTIKVTGIDPTWWSSSNFGINGKALSSSTDYIYLRKRSQNDTNFIADATTEHIKIGFNGLAAVDDALAASAQAISQTGLMFTLGRDSSGNAPLIITTGVANV